MIDRMGSRLSRAEYAGAGATGLLFVGSGVGTGAFMQDRMTKLHDEYTEFRKSLKSRNDGYWLPFAHEAEIDTATGRLQPHEKSAIAGEAADMMHLLFQIAELYGFDLLEETRKKFEINKQRTWEPQPDGTYQHVKGQDDG